MAYNIQFWTGFLRLKIIFIEFQTASNWMLCTSVSFVLGDVYVRACVYSLWNTDVHNVQT